MIDSLNDYLLELDMKDRCLSDLLDGHVLDFTWDYSSRTRVCDKCGVERLIGAFKASLDQTIIPKDGEKKLICSYCYGGKLGKLTAKLTLDQKANIIKLKQDGYKAKDLADMFKVSVFTIYNICKGEVSYKREKKVGPDDKEEILKLRAEGNLLKTIAKKFNISETMVSKICRKDKEGKE